MKLTTVMVQFTQDEILDVLSDELKSDKRMTKKQKVILGQMVIYSGLEQYKVDGYFYRSNKDLCNDCGITEKTLITGLLKLEQLGYISRRTGIRGKASEYTVNSTVNCTVKITNCTKNYSDNTVNYSEKLQCNSENYSTDTDIEKDKENNNIYNIDHINLLQLEIDHLKEEIQILKNHIANMEERTAKKTEDNINIGFYDLFDELDNISMDDEFYNTPANLNVVSQSDQQTSIERTAKRTENNIKIDNFSNFVDVLKDNSSTFEDRESAAIGLQQMINDRKLRGKMFGLAAYLIKQHKKTYNSSTLNDNTLPQVAQTPSHDTYPEDFKDAEAKDVYEYWINAYNAFTAKKPISEEDVHLSVRAGKHIPQLIKECRIPEKYAGLFNRNTGYSSWFTDQVKKHTQNLEILNDLEIMNSRIAA